MGSRQRKNVITFLTAICETQTSFGVQPERSLIGEKTSEGSEGVETTGDIFL